MTDEVLAERIAAIEAHIAQEEAAGRAWSGRSIYRALGGSHRIVNNYMKARSALQGTPRQGQRSRTPPSPAEVRQAMAAQEPSTLQEDLAAAIDAEQQAEQRLSLLEERARSEMLSESEEIESVRLERRVRNLAAVITRLETEIAQAKEVVDIGGFVQSWQPTVTRKRELYAQFYQDIRQMFTTFQAILSQHDSQLDGLMTLPPRLQSYLLDSFLPDRGTIAARLAGNMINPAAWHQILNGLGALQVTPPDALMSNDPGTKPLPPRLMQNAITSTTPVDARNA